MRQQEPRQRRAEEAQAAADEERVLPAARAALASGSVLLDDGEDVGADEGADLTARGGDGVILAADSGGARFGGDEADVVARPGFAEGEEDAGFFLWFQRDFAEEKKGEEEEGGKKRHAYPYTTTKPATLALVSRIEYSPAMRNPTRPWRNTPIERACRGPIQSLRKAPPMAPGR
ncbi:MAG: hypothetical protein Q9167_006900 [Letrouitia subvulpina]